MSERSISCDQVAWLLEVFDRYLPNDNHRQPISRQREMLKYGMLYEVMEIVGVRFEDESARSNGTPPDAKYKTQEECQTKQNNLGAEDSR